MHGFTEAVGRGPATSQPEINSVMVRHHNNQEDLGHAVRLRLGLEAHAAASQSRTSRPRDLRLGGGEHDDGGELAHDADEGEAPGSAPRRRSGASDVRGVRSRGAPEQARGSLELGAHAVERRLELLVRGGQPSPAAVEGASDLLARAFPLGDHLLLQALSGEQLAGFEEQHVQQHH